MLTGRGKHFGGNEKQGLKIDYRAKERKAKSVAQELPSIAAWAMSCTGKWLCLP